ncbi:AfsR/SARP family transcriptional regulator [Actinoplanes sp. NPDC026670]|uniref:AfsR/SARP family transcriptional regulator n=1 Tax=Actinoplanes sp. NPDC026670 TaxID=3154700 RepID=UPI0033CD629C
MTEFRVLGPVEIRAGGQPVGTLQPRQRHVLAALLVDANRPVAWPTLVDRTWGHRPPGDARTSARAHLSRIRGVLATAGQLSGRDAQVIRGGGGYELRTDPDRIDLHRMRRLAGQAGHPSSNTTRRVTLLREAVGLWRGEPLAGLSGEWSDRMRASWGQERLGIVVAWAEAEIQIGNAAAVIGRLGDLTGEHPLVESLAATRMRALQAVGRTAEAVALFAGLRTRLADELGIQPGPELQTVHRTLLRSEPPWPPSVRDQSTAPQIPVSGRMSHRRRAGTAGPVAAGPARWSPHGRDQLAVPAQLPPDIRGFVGRADQLNRLYGLLDSGAQPTAPVIAVLNGTAGVGKTALAVYWAHRVAVHFPDGQLYLNLHGFDPVARPVEPAAAIRRLLHALGVPPARIPADLEACTAVYRSELAGRRMLILLDNAADAAQVRPLLPGTADCLVLVTSRNQLTGLIATEAAHPIAVPLLNTAEAVQLLGHRLGPDRVAGQHTAATEVIRRCARLPLALAIATARAATNPEMPLAALADELGTGRGLRLDVLAGDDPRTDLRAVFSWSYHCLTEPAARLFRLLAVHTTGEIGTVAAAGTAGITAVEAALLLAELAHASLITETRPGGYTCHDLLRAYAMELTTAPLSAEKSRSGTHPASA